MLKDTATAQTLLLFTRPVWVICCVCMRGKKYNDLDHEMNVAGNMQKERNPITNSIWKKEFWDLFKECGFPGKPRETERKWFCLHIVSVLLHFTDNTLLQYCASVGWWFEINHCHNRSCSKKPRKGNYACMSFRYLLVMLVNGAFLQWWHWLYLEKKYNFLD